MMSITFKEARETKNWIRLLKETIYFNEKEAESLLINIEELLKIIGKIQVTTKQI